MLLYAEPFHAVDQFRFATGTFDRLRLCIDDGLPVRHWYIPGAALQNADNILSAFHLKDLQGFAQFPLSCQALPQSVISTDFEPNFHTEITPTPAVQNLLLYKGARFRCF